MKKTISSLSVLAVAIGIAVTQPIHAGEIQYVEGLKTSGYGRAAFGATSDRLVSREAEKADNGMNIIATAGNPYKPTGNLGNRGSQLELHVDYGITNNDMNWVTHINLFTGASDFKSGSTESDYFYLDEWWVSGTGIFPSNPEAGIWMGKRYYGRYENSLNGYQHVNADGIGVGVDNLNLGFGKLNVAVVKDGWGKNSHKYCTAWDADWNCTSENGWGGSYYSLVSKLHGVNLANDINGDLFATYRTYIGSDGDMEPNPEQPGYMTAKDNHPDGFQVGFAIKQGDWGEFNRLVARYGYKAPSSITQSWLPIPSYQYGGFFDGMQEFGEHYRVQYALSHETAVYNENVADLSKSAEQPYDKSVWNQAVVRGTYIWNQRFSTNLELAYDMMDFDVKSSVRSQNPDFKSGTNSSYKITLAQDFHIGGGFWDRPVIRFFVTYGKLDTETTAYTKTPTWSLENVSNLISEPGKRDATTVGVMFETWW
ncbi:carbohydrate porin [Vibrio sp. SM6]|uniref:Carbohydrate porin n=1 Tax=Vibrio agarilyticus TaxID=2726741 RepID=A0A7X8TSW7_9VIBR|nr:carbohydrate porin [Vibrio agarilyticus]NLS14219.1 carbohydrate porin [Vibrio agarilyticus]